MQHGCPLTRAYLLQLEKQTDFRHPLYEWGAHPFGDALELAAASSPSRTLLHLRAFYLLEAMVVRSYTVAGRPTFMVRADDWERSREGLNTLLSYAEEIIRDNQGHFVELQLTNQLEGTAMQNHLPLVANVFVLIRDAAVVLRRSLKNERTPLRGVGRRAAKVMHRVSLEMSAQLKLAYRLLELTEENAPRAWYGI